MTKLAADITTPQHHHDLQHAIAALPSSAQERVKQRWMDLQAQLQQIGLQLPDDITLWQSLPRVWALSDFVAELCCKHPEWLCALFSKQEAQRRYAAPTFCAQVDHCLEQATTESELMAQLRRYRNQQMLRIIWRDLMGWANLDTTIRELSAMADAIIDGAAQRLHAWQCQDYGDPQPLENGLPQTLIVVALGKLGGQELNLSSDVDLMFFYPKRGATQGKRSISHEQFFSRLSQRLIQVLNYTTADGFVFRVDMRLRPFGSSGPIVMSFDAMQNYYQEQGRDWERYALIKARIISGNRASAYPLMQHIRHFVYREKVDFQVLAALKDMHDSIQAEAKSRQWEDNVKLGAGCIRDIEFTGQAFQLLYGGTIFQLQQRRIRSVLNLVEAQGLLTPRWAAQLDSAYIFLRHVEHRLQAYDDRQTHQLPETEEAKERLAFGMHFHTWEAFAQTLNTHRAHVQRQFQHLLSKPKTAKIAPPTQAPPSDYQGTWWDKAMDKELQHLLAHFGFEDTEQALALIKTLAHCAAFKQLSTLGKKRLMSLIPRLLSRTAKTIQPLATLHRAITVLEVMLWHTGYLQLMIRYPQALSRIVRLCDGSAWAINTMLHRPYLIGELLAESRLMACMQLSQLSTRLSQALNKIPPQEEQARLDCIARFKLAHVFRIAARDVSDTLTLMKVSDALTNLATVIIRAIQTEARYKLRNQYPDADYLSPLCIIAYGKLGGLELGYTSDLDLVFLFDDSNAQEEMRHFYTRLVQVMLSMLNHRSGAGSLYQVDTRLRPQGDAGLIANSFSHYANYLKTQAWIWELQALVRARCISGTHKQHHDFEQLRLHCLQQKRDCMALRNEVSAMRTRMYQAAEHDPDGFNLKKGRGGITDIEFMVQYAALAWGYRYPAINYYPDNIRILQSLAAHRLIPQEDVEFLVESYQIYRAALHRLDLQSLPPVAPLDSYINLRLGVQGLWHKILKV